MYLTTLEVVNRFLTGEPVIDPTNAAMRQLYNVEKNDWDEKLMKAAGVTREERDKKTGPSLSPVLLPPPRSSSRNPPEEIHF